MVALVILFGYWKVLRESLLDNKQQELCYEWRRIISAEDKERCPEGLRKDLDKEGNKTLCCGKTSFVVDALLVKKVSDRYDSDINPEMPSLDLKEFNCEATTRKQPIANLVGLDKTKQLVWVGASSKVFWNPHNPSYAHSDIKHLADDGTLYINKSGLYYIASQMKFSLGNTNDTDCDINQTFRHSIHLISYNKGTGKILLENTKTGCDTVTHISEVTSVLGALFKLTEGDRMYVATSHPLHLTYEDTNTFFSIYSV